ncbi:MAG: arylesterase [Rhodobacterales bacterium 12-65-15]|nr:MAG: arylesterase [Rhodobacterales bacterium 12-65-15]
MRRLRNGVALSLLLAGGVGAEPVTVVALGDSLTAGYGLADQSDGLVPQLERWLQARGADVVVENAGVSGDTTAGGLSRLDWALGPETDAVIVTLGGNDLLRGIDPAASRASLAGILEGVKARGLPVLLVAMSAPGNYGPEYKAAFDAMYPDLAAEYDAVLMEDFFAGLWAAGGDPSDPASLAAYVQPDGIHPSAEGVRLIVEGLGPKVKELLARVGG